MEVELDVMGCGLGSETNTCTTFSHVPLTSLSLGFFYFFFNLFY